MDNILHYFTPKEILCQIFSKYLSLQDISCFDIAICNNDKRPVFLEAIGSVACIWHGDEDKYSSYEVISWLSDRNIKIRFLRVRDVVNDDIAINIASLGAYLLQLEIKELKNNGVSDIHIIKIAEGCRNIEILKI
jgi:hypothetical protein